MSFNQIIEILKYSVNYEEFQINYNELIPEIVLIKNKTSLIDWQIFIKVKNELKKMFYNSYCMEFPNAIIRELREAKYIYDINITELIDKIEIDIQKPLKFKIRLEKLK